MLPFIIVGAVGLVVVVVSLFAGELLDLLDGAISATALGSAFTVFGAVGAIVVANELPIWLAYVLAVAIGVAALVSVQLLSRNIRNSDDGEPASPLGLYGTARSSISTSSGEVSLDGPREIETRMAFAAAPIARGTRIRVVEIQGSRVRVEPADSPADPAPADPPPAAAA